MISFEKNETGIKGMEKNCPANCYLSGDFLL